MGPATTTKPGRRLVRVETRAAARGQLNKTRIHLLAPAAVGDHEMVEGLAALCGARPEYGFTRNVRGGDGRDCPRCHARVRPADTIEAS